MSSTTILLTKILCKYCKWTIKAASVFCACPYEWSDTDDLPTYTQSRSKKILWRLSILYQALSTTFLGFRLTAAFASDGPDWEKAYIAALLGAYVVLLFTQITLLVYSRDILELIRRCLRFFPKFEAEFCQDGSPLPRSIRALQILLPTLHCGMLQTAIGFVIPAIMYPEQKPYWTSLLLETMPKTSALHSTVGMFVARTFNGVMLAIIGYNFWFVPIILFFATCFTIFPSISAVNEMREQRITNNNFANGGTQIETYVKLSILMNHLNSVMGMMCGGGQWAIMALAVVSSFCLFRIGGVIGITAGAVGIFSLASIILTWTFLAQIGENSASVLESWKAADWIQSEYNRRQLLTLRPLWFRVGNLYYIDTLLVMTMCEISIENIANMLVVTGN